MNVKKNGLVGLLLLSCSVFQGYAVETLQLSSTDWAPYCGEKLPNGGFTTDIVAEVFKRSGVEIEVSFLPWTRAVIMMEGSQYDGCYPMYWAEKREEKLFYTDTIVYGDVVYYKRKDRDISFEKLEDLKPYRIGIVAGYVNEKDFDNADFLTKEEVSTDLQNLKKLADGRVDLIVIDEFTAMYLVQQNPELAGKMEAIYPPMESKSVHLCMSKDLPDSVNNLRMFNNGLKELKEDGTYDKLLEKHGLKR